MRISFFGSHVSSRREQEFLSFNMGLRGENENQDKDNSRKNVQECNFVACF